MKPARFLSCHITQLDDFANKQARMQSNFITFDDSTQIYSNDKKHYISMTIMIPGYFAIWIMMICKNTTPKNEWQHTSNTLMGSRIWELRYRDLYTFIQYHVLLLLFSDFRSLTIGMYRKIYNIRRTKSQNLNAVNSAFSSLRTIYWSQVFSGEWRCSWGSADRRCSNYIWVINNFIAH